MKKKIIIISIIIVIVAVAVAIGVLQNNNKDKKDYEIATINEYKYFVLIQDNKYGVIDTSGNILVEPKYDDVKIPNPEQAVFICYEKDGTKVFNDKGTQIFTQYNKVEPLRLKNVSSDLMYEKTTLKYQKDGWYGLIDINGNKVTDAVYDDIDTLQYKEGELLVKKSGKYGVISIKGVTIVKPVYDSVDSDKYYENETKYKKSGYIVSKTTDEGYRYGYVDPQGKQIIDTKYNDLSRITEINDNEPYLICAENGQYGLIKNTKQVINNEYQSLAYNEANNTLTALKGKKYGVISLNGDVIVPFEYRQIDIAGDYIYATDENDQVKTYDSKGKEANIDPNLSILKVNNTDYEIYINTADGKTRYSIYKNGNQITKKDYLYIEHLYDNYFIACNTDGKLGVIDDVETTKIPFYYNSIQKIDGMDLVQTYLNETKTIDIYSKNLNKIVQLVNANIEKHDDYIKLYNNDEIKYITKDGKDVKNTELFKDNKIFANEFDGKWGFVDRSGNKVVDYTYDEVTEVNKYGFAGIKKDGKWGIIDGDGKIIVEPTYEINDTDPVFIGTYYQTKYGNGEIGFTK